MASARSVFLAAGVAIALATHLAAALAPSRPAPRATPRETGARLYGDGLGADGAPLRVFLQGDVEAEGPQLTCAMCHARSGMGSVEGGRTVLPIRWPHLAAPGRNHAGARPAYDRDAFVRAVRDGLDSAGRPLDGLMPRYALADADADALLAFMESLDGTPSPGASATTIELATVITPDADPADAATMLAVLERFVADKNAQTRQEARRRAVDRAEAQAMYKGFREWRLHAWRLSGERATWRAQLERHYGETPVFALLSGIGGDWSEVDAFAAAHGIPGLLPNTDLPAPSRDERGTRYYSRGLHGEAEAIAARLADAPAPRLLQIVPAATSPAAEAAAASLARLARTRGWPEGTVEPVVEGDAAGAWLAARISAAGADAVVLWLPPADLARLGGAALGTRVFVSGTLAGDAEAVAIDATEVLRVQPFVPAGAQAEAFRRTALWLEARGLHAGSRRVQDQTLFACILLGETLKHMRDQLFRDFLLERLDHGSGMAATSAFYPRLSFGPGQPFLSKGVYVVPLGGGHGAGASAPNAPQWFVP